MGTPYSNVRSIGMSKFFVKLWASLFSGLLTTSVVVGLLVYQDLTFDYEGEEIDEMGNLPELEAVAEGQEVQMTTKPNCDSGDELIWLACGIYFEARSESLRGQHYVAQVILNRVEDPRWPNTIEAVVRDGERKRHRCQFSFMCDGKPERIKNEKAWQVALEVATTALENYYDGGEVTCAHSYRAGYVTSARALKWFATLKTDNKVGEHIFYCD